MLLMSRMGPGASDIMGYPFQQQAWLAAVLLWALALAMILIKRGSLGEGRLLTALFGLAMLGKVAMAGLSSGGLATLGLKITSVNSNYFTVAGRISGPLAYLSGFNAGQAGSGYHVDVHPPLPVLLYWALRVLLFSKPALAALAVMALSASAILPLYRLGKGLAGPEGALASVCLFITSPLNLILGNAGIDSVVFTLVAVCVWLLWEAAQRDGFLLAAGAGASLGLASLCSFASIAALLFMAAWAPIVLWRRRDSGAGFVRPCLVLAAGFCAGLAAVHLLLFAASLGRFNYLEALRTARVLHQAANQYRSYALWSWANVLLYAGYAGPALVLLWVFAVARSLVRADSAQPFVQVSAALVLTLVLCAYGRAEVQRQFLFGAVFLLPVAAAALPRSAGGRVQAPALAVALGLNIVNAVLLQIYVLDYW